MSGTMTKLYDIYIEPDVHKQRNILPGHLRQRVGRLISELAAQPRPQTDVIGRLFAFA